MKIKLFEGSHKKIEKEVNEFISRSDIKVLKVELKTSFNGTLIMVTYE